MSVNRGLGLLEDSINALTEAFVMGLCSRDDYHDRLRQRANHMHGAMMVLAGDDFDRARALRHRVDSLLTASLEYES